jgi:glycerol-3-phosphate dehydrogenase (NAD(P)+)
VSKVAVFGSGSWGTAFSLVLADAGNEVVMWARRQEVSDVINTSHENTDYLPGVALPASISATPGR